MKSTTRAKILHNLNFFKHPFAQYFCFWCEHDERRVIKQLINEGLVKITAKESRGFWIALNN